MPKKKELKKEGLEVEKLEPGSINLGFGWIKPQDDFETIAKGLGLDPMEVEHFMLKQFCAERIKELEMKEKIREEKRMKRKLEKEKAG